jgi:hypothetical protein
MHAHRTKNYRENLHDVIKLRMSGAAIETLGRSGSDFDGEQPPNIKNAMFKTSMILRSKLLMDGGETGRRDSQQHIPQAMDPVKLPDETIRPNVSDFDNLSNGTGTPGHSGAESKTGHEESLALTKKVLQNHKNTTPKKLPLVPSHFWRDESLGRISVLSDIEEPADKHEDVAATFRLHKKKKDNQPYVGPIAKLALQFRKNQINPIDSEPDAIAGKSSSTSNILKSSMQPLHIGSLAHKRIPGAFEGHPSTAASRTALRKPSVDDKDFQFADLETMDLEMGATALNEEERVIAHGPVSQIFNMFMQKEQPFHDSKSDDDNSVSGGFGDSGSHMNWPVRRARRRSRSNLMKRGAAYRAAEDEAGQIIDNGGDLEDDCEEGNFDDMDEELGKGKGTGK